MTLRSETFRKYTTETALSTRPLNCWDRPIILPNKASSHKGTSPSTVHLYVQLTRPRSSIRGCRCRLLQYFASDRQTPRQVPQAIHPQGPPLVTDKTWHRWSVADPGGSGKRDKREGASNHFKSLDFQSEGVETFCTCLTILGSRWAASRHHSILRRSGTSVFQAAS